MGLGETLVGAYPGRALSFISKKNALDSPQVMHFSAHLANSRVTDHVGK